MEPDARRPTTRLLHSALNGYKPSEQLLWICQLQNPNDWMKPLPPLIQQPTSPNWLEGYVNSVPADNFVPQKGMLVQSEQYGKQWKGSSYEQTSASSWQGKSNWQDNTSCTNEWNSAGQGKDAKKGIWNSYSGWQYGAAIQTATVQASISQAEAQSSHRYEGETRLRESAETYPLQPKYASCRQG
eukprot:1213043-Amphidinium_carterae.5